jgi:hypothetical protein
MFCCRKNVFDIFRLRIFWGSKAKKWKWLGAFFHFPILPFVLLLLLTLIFKVRTPSGKRLRTTLVYLSFFLFCQVIDARVETRSTLIIKHTIVSQKLPGWQSNARGGIKKKTYIAVVAVGKCRLVRKNKVLNTVLKFSFVCVSQLLFPVIEHI